jgi:hypothetical protein
MKRVTELKNTEARKFFLKESSYCNFDLPKYFVFDELLKQLYSKIKNHEFSKKKNNNSPRCYDNINYKLLSNESGRYAWRPLQLIHPVVYVSLVKAITKEKNWEQIKSRFREFESNKKIQCHSIPVVSEDEKLSDNAAVVSQWYQGIEQRSIELSLKFEYVLFTDMTNCYGSIYTHIIAWAIHGKQIAKDKRNDCSYIGNSIDQHVQSMSYGQTNGIPIGSTLMDFIAEIVLGYVDLELSNKIKNENINDYQIIRFRDDYRIFTNNPQEAELIAKLLTEVLISIGMKLNVQKTMISNNVIGDSIKPDKLYWISEKRGDKELYEHLLLIHILSEKHPNSGSLAKALNKYYKHRIHKLTELSSIRPLISILIDIMYKNPRTYQIIPAILSKLLSFLDYKKESKAIISDILAKFEKIPNTGYLHVWLQRITIKDERDREYNELLCKKVNDNSIPIWNTDWCDEPLKKIINETPIIDENIIKNIDPIIKPEEVQLFMGYDEA